MFKIRVLFIATLFVRLYESGGVLLTCGKHLHDRIMSSRKEVNCYIDSNKKPSQQ